MADPLVTGILLDFLRDLGVAESFSFLSTESSENGPPVDFLEGLGGGAPLILPGFFELLSINEILCDFLAGDWSSNAEGAGSKMLGVAGSSTTGSAALNGLQ